LRPSRSCQQLGRLGQAPDALLAERRQRAGARLEHDRAARAQQREVGLRGRVLVHRRVHRGREDQRPPARERRRGEQVVGVPVGELGERVGARGRDGEDVRALDELQVPDRRVRRGGVAREGAPHRVVLPLGRQHRGAGDAGEGRGADEARRRRRLDDAHRMAGLDGQPGQLEGLVGGDPARDAEEDARHAPAPLAARAGRLSRRGSGT
jgi:hypothetical protein